MSLTQGLSNYITRITGLTKEQKKNLLGVIRYSYLSQEELYSMAKDPVFKQAKEYILEGLALRLSNYESFKCGTNITTYTTHKNDQKSNSS
jgi:hypothetical protein